MEIISPAFQHNGDIPPQYTCDGEDKNPPLQFRNAPTGTASYALIVDDPDAPGGTWNHWVVWNIAAEVAELLENSVPVGARQGTNDFQRLQWGGPCPPNGEHRYFFRLYALDALLELKEGATKDDLLEAMENHILEQAELMGKYMLEEKK